MCWVTYGIRRIRSKSVHHMEVFGKHISGYQSWFHERNMHAETKICQQQTYEWIRFPICVQSFVFMDCWLQHTKCDIVFRSYKIICNFRTCVSDVLFAGPNEFSPMILRVAIFPSLSFSYSFWPDSVPSIIIIFFALFGWLVVPQLTRLSKSLTWVRHTHKKRSNILAEL